MHGAPELDLLVDTHDARKFDATLLNLGFCAVRFPAWETEPATSHYYGLDEATGEIIHVHAYYRVITGGGLVKRYYLPFANAILSRTQELRGIPVPCPNAELAVFVLRKAVEHGSVLEYPFVRRERREMLAEFAWLESRADVNESVSIVRESVPSVPTELFLDAIDCLRHGAPTIRTYRVGRQIMRFLTSFEVRPSLVSVGLGWYRLFRILGRRIRRRPLRSTLPRGGFVIAFVGPEASGKSTLLTETGNWLGQVVSVGSVHAGKPPSTWMTFVPNLVLPVLRSLFPRSRTNTVEAETSIATGTAGLRKASLLYVVRSLMIAHDQLSVLRKAHRRARRGSVVLSDRYPSTNLGGMDGPRVDPGWFAGKSRLKTLLARREKVAYESVPAPDLVFLLTVPLEVALKRNATRTKRGGPEPEDYVRRRHALIERWRIPGVPIVHLDTNQPLKETQLVVRRAIWQII
jgi:thymidylate kinase